MNEFRQPPSRMKSRTPQRGEAQIRRLRTGCLRPFGVPPRRACVSVPLVDARCKRLERNALAFRVVREARLEARHRGISSPGLRRRLARKLVTRRWSDGLEGKVISRIASLVPGHEFQNATGAAGGVRTMRNQMHRMGNLTCCGRALLLLVLLTAATQGSTDGGGNPGRRPSYQGRVKQVDGTEFTTVDRVSRTVGGFTISGTYINRVSPSERERNECVKDLEAARAELGSEIEHGVLGQDLKQIARAAVAGLARQLEVNRASRGVSFNSLHVTVVKGANRPLSAQFSQMSPDYSDAIRIPPLRPGGSAGFTVRIPAGLAPGSYTVFIRPMDLVSSDLGVIVAGADAVTIHVGNPKR